MNEVKSGRYKHMAAGHPDNFQTPPIALQPLMKYINPNWVIWECACGKGYLSDELIRYGHWCINTDVLDGEQYDFLQYEPKGYDCIITNPPFRLKDQFLERCYQLKKPFALLMPISALEGMKRQKLYRTYGLQVIFMDKRINFETPNNVEKSSAWFSSAWFTLGLNLLTDMVFETIQNK